MVDPIERNYELQVNDSLSERATLEGAEEVKLPYMDYNFSAHEQADVRERQLLNCMDSYRRSERQLLAVLKGCKDRAEQEVEEDQGEEVIQEVDSEKGGEV